MERRKLKRIKSNGSMATDTSAEESTGVTSMEGSVAEAYLPIAEADEELSKRTPEETQVSATPEFTPHHLTCACLLG